MPNRNTSRRAGRLVLFAVADRALWALGRGGADETDATPDPWTLDVELDEATAKPRRSKPRFSKRRLATTLAFTTLFFSGAAFSAGAGDLVVSAVEDETATTETTTTEEAPAEEPAAEEESAEAAPAPAPDPEPAPEAPAAEEPAADNESAPAEEPESEPAEEPSDGADPAPAEDPVVDDPADDPAEDPVDESDEEPNPGPKTGADSGGGSTDSDDDHQAAGMAPVTEETAPADVDLENAAFATVWLHRDMPDPTPPARRLKRSFAKDLLRVSERAKVDWALVLGVLRARGHRSPVPATVGTLTRTANDLAQRHANQDEWRALLSLAGRTAFADRASAVARYNRAVGVWALVRGLKASKATLERRVLRDDRITVYAGGRWDIEHHRIDVRVLALLRYLAESHEQVTVSCLDTGHGLYSRPGVVSAHKYGLAVDIAALEGQTIVGHQQAGSVTERAVRNILLMPAELRPRQVISLLGLGGPSFPMANHDDHIHVGY